MKSVDIAKRRLVVIVKYRARAAHVLLRELSVLTTLSQSVMSQSVWHPQMLSNSGCAVFAISTPFKLNLRAIEVKISNYFRKNNQTCIHIHIQHSKKITLVVLLCFKV